MAIISLNNKQANPYFKSSSNTSSNRNASNVSKTTQSTTNREANPYLKTSVNNTTNNNNKQRTPVISLSTSNREANPLFTGNTNTTQKRQATPIISTSATPITTSNQNKTTTTTTTPSTSKTTSTTSVKPLNSTLKTSKVTTPTTSKTVLPTRAETTEAAPKIQAEYTDNTKLIQSMYSQDKKNELESAYSQQQAALEADAKAQREENIYNTEQTIRDSYASTNQSLRDLSQIRANLGGASVSDPTYKQGLIDINTNLTNVISNSKNQLMQMNSEIETELAKAKATNNLQKVQALQNFDTAMITTYLNEVSRIDSIKNSVNEKNADLEAAQKQLNENKYQFDVTQAQQEQERKDANTWKQVSLDEWQKEYDLSVKQYNSDNSYKLQQLGLSASQIRQQAEQFAIEQANSVLAQNQSYALQKAQLDASTSSAASTNRTDYLKSKVDSIRASTLDNSDYYQEGLSGAITAAKKQVNYLLTNGYISSVEAGDMLTSLGLT